MSVASLEAELSRQKAINNELRSQLYEVESGVSRGHSALEDCNQNIQNKLNTSAQKLEDSRRKGLAAIELQGEIDRMYVRFKHMELANKKIRECNNKKYYEFANYRSVRKLVQGMMDNLDVNMVSDAVIYKSIEAQHLKSPDYWLTCVLIAIMAWKNDDKSLAEHAISIAIGLDKKKSAIFMMLFNLRMDRDEAALKWFYTYQECPLQGSDQRTFLLLFALMNKTINSSETISDKSRIEIREFIQRVIQNNVTAMGYDENEMVKLVERYYDRMDSREMPAYPLLRKHCKDFPMLSKAMMKAQGNITILEFLKKVINVDIVHRNAFVKNFIDEIVAQANSEEKGVEDEIKYNEMIIKYQGDVDKAKEVYDATQLHDESELNLIAEMIDWVFIGDEEELDAQGRLNMLTLTKNLHEQAIENHTEAYRTVDNTVLSITIDDYASKVDFNNAAAEEKKIEQHYTEIKKEKLAQIKNTGAYIGFGVAAAAAVASPFVSFALLIVTAIAAGYGVLTLQQNKSARKQLEINCVNAIQATAEIMKRLFAERQAYLDELAGYDMYVEQIQAEFAKVV